MSLKNISLDIDFVRSKFPAFEDPLSRDWSFFENAGGSYVPKTVINQLNKLSREEPPCSQRGNNSKNQNTNN